VVSKDKAHPSLNLKLASVKTQVDLNDFFVFISKFAFILRTGKYFIESRGLAIIP
jgi:hypothetical protein